MEEAFYEGAKPAPVVTVFITTTKHGGGCWGRSEAGGSSESPSRPGRPGGSSQPPLGALRPRPPAALNTMGLPHRSGRAGGRRL